MPDLLRYKFPGANWELALPTEPLETLMSHAQRSMRAPEAAGQLYARELNKQTVIIEHATLLRPRWSSRTKFRFNLAEAAKERAALFTQGLHCIGLWHTHPEPFPQPSAEDLELAKDHANAAGHQLAGFLFLILGTSPLPEGLLVGAHDSRRFWEATALRPSE